MGAKDLGRYGLFGEGYFGSGRARASPGDGGWDGPGLEEDVFFFGQREVGRVAYMYLSSYQMKEERPDLEYPTSSNPREVRAHIRS